MPTTPSLLFNTYLVQLSPLPLKEHPIWNAFLRKPQPEPTSFDSSPSITIYRNLFPRQHAKQVAHLKQIIISGAPNARFRPGETSPNETLLTCKFHFCPLGLQQSSSVIKELGKICWVYQNEDFPLFNQPIVGGSNREIYPKSAINNLPSN